MPGWCGDLYEEGSPEVLIKILYTTAFRLTGDHRNAALLVQKTVSGINWDRSSGAAVEVLCRVFLAETVSGGRRIHKTTATWKTGVAGSRDSTPVQNALMELAPEDRVAVVLRDVLDLSYTEIAAATMSSEKEVAGRVASARWALRKMLALATVRNQQKLDT